MLQGEDAVIGVVTTALLALAAVAGRALTPYAGAVAAAFGIVIVIFVGFPYLALLVLFVAASALATRYRFDEKKRQQLQEGRMGERGVSNVVAHIVLPTAIAAVGGIAPSVLGSRTIPLLFACALAFGASDTFASEFGVLSGHARSILTGKPVTPGTNGGVSSLGHLFAFVGAVTTAVVGLLLFWAFRTPIPNPFLFVATVATAGFVACQVDSVLGELYENDGRLSKGSTNFLGMLSAVAIAALVLAVAGGLS
ncbi:MAG TPA: DUF92 domain-containing protein [Thermoplasmata archaeon]|nr:DUF92 domain-containing protein [Thermoplasmata archaeon]